MTIRCGEVVWGEGDGLHVTVNICSHRYQVSRVCTVQQHAMACNKFERQVRPPKLMSTIWMLFECMHRDLRSQCSGCVHYVCCWCVAGLDRQHSGRHRCGRLGLCALGLWGPALPSQDGHPRPQGDRLGFIMSDHEYNRVLVASYFEYVIKLSLSSSKSYCNLICITSCN